MPILENEPMTRREVMEAFEAVLTFLSGLQGVNPNLLNSTRNQVKRVVLGEPIPVAPPRV